MTDTKAIPTIVEELREYAELHQDLLGDRAADRIEQLEAENEDLKTSVLAFCAPWAVRQAEVYGLPYGTIDAHYYDILKAAGGKMDHFTRFERKSDA